MKNINEQYKRESENLTGGQAYLESRVEEKAAQGGMPSSRVCIRVDPSSREQAGTPEPLGVGGRHRGLRHLAGFPETQRLNFYSVGKPSEHTVQIQLNI